MSREKASEGLRHAARERLRFIDTRLFWEARINRADVIEAFAVSPAQAALDFREYLKLAGDGVSYDTRAKCYVATAAFQPVFEPPDGARALADFAASGDPVTESLPRLHRPLDAATAAGVRRAARDEARLLIDYQSLTRPGASRRWIAPQRLVSDGERWHARAWCFMREEWRDFVLARILAIHETKAAGELPPDVAWEKTVRLRLRPARHLSDSQKAAVAREFAMSRGRLDIALPMPLIPYARVRYGLDRPGARLEAEIFELDTHAAKPGG